MSLTFRSDQKLKENDFVDEPFNRTRFSLKSKKLGKAGVFALPVHMQEDPNVALEPKKYLFKDNGRMYEFKDRVHQQMVERINYGQSKVSPPKKRVSKGETLPISDFNLSFDSKHSLGNTQSAKKL